MEINYTSFIPRTLFDFEVMTILWQTCDNGVPATTELLQVIRYRGCPKEKQSPTSKVDAK